jgi:hypothetical protein
MKWFGLAHAIELFVGIFGIGMAFAHTGSIFSAVFSIVAAVAFGIFGFMCGYDVRRTSGL